MGVRQDLDDLDEVTAKPKNDPKTKDIDEQVKKLWVRLKGIEEANSHPPQTKLSVPMETEELRALLSKYTETLAQVERLEKETESKVTAWRADRDRWKEAAEKAVEALEWYANPWNHATNDGGECARKALQSIKGAEPNATD